MQRPTLETSAGNSTFLTGVSDNVVENLEDAELIEEVTGAEWGQEYKAVEVFDVFA